MGTSEYKSNLNTVFSVAVKKLWLILLIAVAASVIISGFTYLFISPVYSSTSKFYVYNNTSSNINSSITSQDINAAQTLVETYIVIIRSDTVLEKIAETADVDYTAEELDEMLSAGSISGTEVFYIKVSAHDRNEALRISEAIVDVVPGAITNVVKGGDVSVIDTPKLDDEADFPSIPLFAVIGFLLGAIISFASFFIREVTDTTIYSEEDIKQSFGYPIVGQIPTISLDSYENSKSKRRIRK